MSNENTCKPNTETKPKSNTEEVIDSNVVALIEKKRKMKLSIEGAENTIREAKKSIKEIEKLLFRQCKHRWQYDYSCAFDDHTKHFCSTCGVWKNPYWYA